MTTIKNSPAMMSVFTELKNLLTTQDKDYLKKDSHDEKLWTLSLLIIGIGIDEKNNVMLLKGIPVACILWLKELGLTEEDIFFKISDERLRQRKLFADGKISFMVSSPVVCVTRKRRVLIEEIGEVAEAIDQVEQHPKSKFHLDHLITELVQVATVAVAWLESFEACPAVALAKGDAS
jgi:hypothetical protein